MKKWGLILIIQFCDSLVVNVLLVMLTAMVFKNQGNISALMILMTIPAIFFSKFFGQLIDKGVAKKSLQLIILFSLAAALVLAWKQYYMYNTVLYLFAFIIYVMDCFVRLYLSVLVTDATNDQHYLKFNSLLNFVENVGIIVGPLIGGIWVQKNHIAFGFLVISIFLVLILGAVFYLKVKGSLKIVREKETDDEELTEVSAENGEEENKASEKGISSLNKLLSIYIAACIFAFAIGLINVRQISFVINHYSVNEMGYSITESLWGFGMIVGCFVIVAEDKKLSTSQLVGINYILVGICVFSLFINHYFTLALLLFLLLGIGNMVISIGFTTLVQKMSDKINMGKNLGRKNMYQQITTLTAMGLAGVFEKTVSSELLYLIAGILLMIFGTFILCRFRKQQEM